MLDPRGHQHQVAGAEGMALGPVQELAAAGDHHVHLVAGVRLLGIGPARRVELDAEAVALEGDREPLAGGARQLALQLGGREPVAIGHRNLKE